MHKCLLATVVLVAASTLADSPASGEPRSQVHRTPAAERTPRRQSARTAKLATKGLQLGVFSGGFDPQAAARFETWLGRKSDFNVEFLTDTAYTDYLAPDGTRVTDALTHAGWLPARWSSAGRRDRNMLFSVPLATKQDPSLEHVAEGRYDPLFSQIAKTVAEAYPSAIIRIGWEFNGDWYAWAAKDRTEAYVAAFRRVSKIFKTASRAFTIDWCPAHGFSGSQLPPEKAYPGDDVVDVIGMDFYNDYRWGEFKDNPIKRWAWYKDHPGGLSWHAQFAAAHHKPMSFPEWGVNRDDPYFIERVHAWISTHPFAYAAYWNSNSMFQGSLEQYPRVAATYRDLFGGAASVAAK